MSTTKTKPVAAQVALAKKAAALKAEIAGPAPAAPRHSGDRGDRDDGDAAVVAPLLSREEVLKILGITYPTLWVWVREGHFPAPRDLGLKRRDGSLGGRLGWIAAEVQQWIDNRPRKYPKGTAASVIAKRSNKGEEAAA